jgi:transposase
MKNSWREAESGSYASVRDHLIRRRTFGKKPSSHGNELSPAPLSPRQATFLFLRRPEKLTPEEQADLLTLRQTHPEVNQTCELVQQFAQMLRTRSGEHLDAWLAKVADSRIPELQSCLLGIERDKPAVAAGLTLPHSNGIVEGKINK